MDSLTISRKSEEFDFIYDIVWTRGFDSLPACLSTLGLKSEKICIVTDSNVAGLYLDDVRQPLSAAGYQIYDHIFPAGEESKHLDTISGIYDFLIRNHFERKDLLIALGGGVTGDMTGFAAATYLRGIDFIQVPTTLLAQVDSSVGGKTGVDFRQFKNMVGAFCQPRLVYMNTDTLKTLPNDQFSSGIGEVIKTALIRDAGLFRQISKKREEILSRDPDTLENVIRSCCCIKAAVVEEDPKEKGIRAILNFGHTIGHALEKAMDFAMLHGSCVGFGMICAAKISRKRGYLTEDEMTEITDLCEYFGLPSCIPAGGGDCSGGVTAALGRQPDPHDILALTKSDKKMEKGHIRFILLKEIGNAVIDYTVTDEEILDSMC